MIATPTAARSAARTSPTPTTVKLAPPTAAAAADAHAFVTVRPAVTATPTPPTPVCTPVTPVSPFYQGGRKVRHPAAGPGFAEVVTAAV